MAHASRDSVAEVVRAAGRGRHRRAERRRVRQGHQLVAIRARAPERLRAPAGRRPDASRFAARRRSQPLRRVLRRARRRDGPPATAGAAVGEAVCVGADHVHRPGRAAARHRQLQGRAEGVPAWRRASCRWRRRRASSPTARTSTTRATRRCCEAIADAMRVEYRAIVDAGLLLQLDDARAAVTYDRMVPPASFADYRELARAAGRRASTTRSRASRRSASAITSAGEAGPARTPPTCRSRTSSTWCCACAPAPT